MAIYFASDFHLGMNQPKSSREREKIIVDWLTSIQSDTDELYLLGDLFDYWFEYKNVVPKGYVRLLAKLAEFTDNGIPVHVFTGNHDMWMFGYLEEEIGVNIYYKPVIKTIQNKKILLAHGDGLGPGDHGYKFIKKLFSNKINQWLFARLHPNFGIGLMKIFSNTSRENKVVPLLGAEQEWLIQFSESTLKKEYYDFLIFGHRHLPIDHLLSNKKSRYINTGDWFNHYSYAVLNNGELCLKKFVPNEK